MRICEKFESQLVFIFLRDQFETLEDYQEMAKTLPQDSTVFIQLQGRQPDGYDPAVYGEWPGTVLLIQLEIASSHKTPTTRFELGQLSSKNAYFLSI